MIFGILFPDLGEKLQIAVTPQEVTNFFVKLVKDTVTYRETNNIKRNDFFQLLINMRNSGDALTIEEMAAQSFVFFLAGFETSSTTMTFTLYELSKRPYPPLAILNRECVKDYKIPDQDVIIEKGTRVFIPVLAIHYDKDYYPEPEKFDPERFSEENKKERPTYAYLPFGEGPRVCIGLRFGLMQSKVGLASLLRHYKFSVSSKTKEPLKMKPSAFILAVEGEVWLTAEKI